MRKTPKAKVFVGGQLVATGRVTRFENMHERMKREVSPELPAELVAVAGLPGGATARRLAEGIAATIWT